MACSQKLLGLALLLLLPACGSSRAIAQEGPGDTVGYTDTTDVVVAGGKTWIVTGDPSGCVQLGDQCVDIGTVKQQSCGSPDAQADIVVVDGKVVEVICYPPKSSGVSIDKVSTTTNGTTEVPQNANNSVITFGPETNGKPVEGDVTLNAENISLIGNGVANTIIHGKVTLDSNNAHLRGLTVDGDLIIDKNSNNATVAFVAVRGKLSVVANDVTILSTIVFGDLTVSGHAASLVAVGVQGKTVFEQAAALCNGTYVFTDTNKSFTIQTSEMGAAFACGSK
jgi:hypothetical protein